MGIWDQNGNLGSASDLPMDSSRSACTVAHSNSKSPCHVPAESAHSACQISEPVGLGLRVRVRVSENRLQPRLSSVIGQQRRCQRPGRMQWCGPEAAPRESQSSDLLPSLSCSVCAAVAPLVQGTEARAAAGHAAALDNHLVVLVVPPISRHQYRLRLALTLSVSPSLVLSLSLPLSPSPSPSQRIYPSLPTPPPPPGPSPVCLIL